MKKERGFTLMETLITITIILVLIALSSVSYSCVIDSTSASEAKGDMRNISTLVDSYYMDRGKLPLGKKVTNVDKEVVTKATEYINSLGLPQKNINIQDFINSGSVYEIDSKIITTNGELSKEKLMKYYIIHLSDSDKVKYSGIERTILMGSAVHVCTGEDIFMRKGDTALTGISKSLDFEVTDTYIDCPTPELCKKLDDLDK